MTSLVCAQLADTGEEIGIAPLPSEIQWMPPGQHTIVAHKNGAPEEMTIRVTPAGAARMQLQLNGYLSALNAGSEDKPYFDFNHDDREASAHVLSFAWGGDSPRTGGIRARVQWTTAGKQALVGRAYRRFSPSFWIDAAGEIAGAPVNMGGLVNKAAFKTIMPIVAKGAHATVDAAEAHLRTVRAADGPLFIQALYATPAWEIVNAKLQDRYVRTKTTYAGAEAINDWESAWNPNRPKSGYNHPIIREAMQIYEVERVPLAQAFNLAAKRNPAMWSEYQELQRQAELGGFKWPPQ